MKKIKSLILNFNASNELILEKILKNKYKTLIFLKEKKLYGVLSDGDLRKKYFLKKNKDFKISSLINKNPVYFEKGFNLKVAIKKMKLKRIIIAPIVDKRKEVINLLDFYSFNESLIMADAIIMAGGKGKRLMPLTKSMPKPMLRLHKKPIISYSIKQMENNNISKINISVNYKKEKIIQYLKNKPNISLIHEDKYLGTAGGLSLIDKNKINNDLIIVNGDVICSIDYKNLLKFHKDLKSDLTICVKEMSQKLQYGVMKFSGTNLKNILEKPVTTYHVNAGIYVMRKEILNYLTKNKKINMDDFINLLIKKKKKLAIYPLREDWIDIGSKDKFNEAKRAKWIKKI